MSARRIAFASLAGVLASGAPARAAPLQWPTAGELLRVALLLEYNTRLVVLSTALLGLASGVIGSFLLLRKRSLMGDALSHACLPGIGLAFAVMVTLGGSGKSLPGLLAGAAVTGLAGVWLVQLIRESTRIRDDAAMGIVLSVFFGLGVAIIGMVQNLPGASAAGLEGFIYGKTASMAWLDFQLITAVTIGVVVFAVLLLKEFLLLCFDEAYASAQGWPVRRLDMILLGLVTAVTVVGLQAVGLILIIAFLITPAAAARFWTEDLRWMLGLGATIGAASGWIGASFSALLPGLPAGAVIVLVAALLFTLSMLFGPARGVVPRYRRYLRLRRKVGRQHLLRAAYEILEAQQGRTGEIVNRPVPMDQLLAHRSWSPARLRALLRQARAEDHIEAFDAHQVRLSESGLGEAARTTRNHRLWEMYLIRHADTAPHHVDRDADAVEHILSADMVRELEKAWERRPGAASIPGSPHTIAPTPQSS